MKSGLFEIIQMGGPIMWFIFIGSVIAVGVFAERMIFYHRCAVPLVPFLKGIRLLLSKKNYQEALDRCDEAYGPSIKVVQAAIVKRDLSKVELKEVIQEVAQLQMPRIEANLSILSTVAHVMPLLGLFGTVTGMIEAFREMTAVSGGIPIGQLAGGIWEALITTAGGLGVAIPAYVAYNYLNARVTGLVSDMERAGIEVVQMLKEPDSLSPLPAESGLNTATESIKRDSDATPDTLENKKAERGSGTGSADKTTSKP